MKTYSKYFILTALYLLSSRINVNAQPNSWVQAYGPYGGAISTLRMSNEYIFAGTNGGLFVSTNNGDTWIHKGFAGQRISSIVLSESYLFVSTSTMGVYRSRDRGNTWESVSIGLPGYGITALAIIDSIVFAAVFDNGMYRSLDWGMTWSASNTGIDNRSIRNLTTINSTIIASSAGTSGSGMFRSTDHGVNWTRIDPYIYAWNVETTARYGNVLYGADFENSAMVKYSTDEGATWYYPPGSKAPSDIIQTLYADSSGLYAGTFMYGIFCSRALNGASWNDLNPGLSNKTITAINGINGHLYAGTLGGLYSSTDFGVAWKNTTNGLNACDVRGLASAGGTMFAGTNGSGVYKSTDGGVHWQECAVSPGAYIFDLLSVAGGVLAMYSDYPYSDYSGKLTALSIDGGQSWRRWASSLETYPRGLAIGSTTIYANTETGIYRSDLSGAAWKKVLDGFFPRQRSIAIIGSVVLATDSYSLYSSTDNGNTWTKNSTPGTFTDISTLAAVGTRFYAGCTQINDIYCSTDSGATWTLFPVPLGGGDVNQIVGDGAFVAAGLSNNGGVVVSTDSGKTWNHYNFKLTNASVQTLLYKAPILFAGTAGNGMFSSTMTKDTLSVESTVFPNPKSSGLGSSVEFAWSDIYSALSYRLQISLSPSFDTLQFEYPSVVGLSKIVDGLFPSTTYYWRISGNYSYPSWIQWVSSSFRTKSPDGYTLFQNFPNPFNSITQIRFELPIQSRVSVKVYNMLGQVVEELAAHDYPDGPQTISWNGSNGSSGIYFVVIRANDFFAVKKMLLLK